jgi:hypothetical protein
MRKIVKLRVLLTGVATAAVCLGLTGATPAAAAGQGGYGPTHVYEIEASFNCDNPSVCGGGGGGMWGWIALNGTIAGGTGDYEVTDCFHTTGGGGSAGAVHMAGDATWQNLGAVLAIEPEGGMPFFVPSAPGHYSTEDFLGQPAPPGFSIQLQVVLIPTSTS